MNVVIVNPQSVAFTTDWPGAQFARDDVVLPEPAFPDALGSAPLRTVLTKNPVIVDFLSPIAPPKVRLSPLSVSNAFEGYCHRYECAQVRLTGAYSPLQGSSHHLPLPLRQVAHQPLIGLRSQVVRQPVFPSARPIQVLG